MKDWLIKGGRLRKSDAIVISIMLFPVLNLFGNGVLSYYDEVIGLISILIIFSDYIQHGIQKEDSPIVWFLIAVTILGVVSNIINKIFTNLFPICVDILWLWKTFATFLAFKLLCSNQWIGYRVRSLLAPMAKVVIWFVLFISIVQQFIDIGAGGNLEAETLYGGIKVFGFFWNNGIGTGWLIFCCILIISSIEVQTRKLLIYLILATIPLFLTGSSLAICWLFIVYSLLIIFRSRSIVRTWHLIFVVIGVLGLVYTEFITYFSSEGVRGTLLEYACIVANKYFPLGSGFATYGSDMAQRYYSQLYVDFGWEDTYAFGTESHFLNDNFFATIIGQFGWFGFAFYLGCLFFLFKQVNTMAFSKFERIALLATVLTIGAVMIGSGSAKSMMGVCTFAVLGILVAEKDKVRR